MNICKYCRGVLIEKATKKSPEQLKKSYYYKAYYFCAKCKRLYHDEKFKVINKDQFLFENLGFLGVPEVEIWTDGACTGNGYEHAKAAWAFVAGKYEEAGRVIGKQTNNTAEAYAIYHALLWASQKNHKRIKIYSDSQISINNLKKSVNKIKENREIFEKIDYLIAENNLQVMYEKVLGHSGDVNNERADRLANSLAEKGN